MDNITAEFGATQADVRLKLTTSIDGSFEAYSEEFDIIAVSDTTCPKVVSAVATVS